MEENRIFGNVCCNCGELFLYNVKYCPVCGFKNFKEKFFIGDGEIYSYTEIYYSAESHKKDVPYIIALVKLKEGLKLMGKVINKFKKKQLSIGVPVKFVAKDREGYKFELKQ